MEILKLIDRQLAFEDAQQQLQQAPLGPDGLFVQSRWPLERGKNIRRSGPILRDAFEQNVDWLPLVWGPSAFYWCYPTLRLPFSLAKWQQTHEQILANYHPALASVEAAQQYVQEVEHLLRWEETELFGPLSQLLGDPRTCRELGYEHQGLRRAMQAFPGLVERWLSGEASRRELEKMELDLHHLFEHHWERKEPLLLLGASG